MSGFAEQLTNQHLAEVTDLRLVLSNQEATLECQKAEIQQLRQHISERSSQREQGKAQNTNESENRHRRKQQNTRPVILIVFQYCQCIIGFVPGYGGSWTAVSWRETQ